jgi:hypothetical protein
MLARNPWNAAFGTGVAFADLAGRQTAWTADRRAFIGRNGTLAQPAALAHPAGVTGTVGCAGDARRGEPKVPGRTDDSGDRFSHSDHLPRLREVQALNHSAGGTQDALVQGVFGIKRRDHVSRKRHFGCVRDWQAMAPEPRPLPGTASAPVSSAA